MFKTSIGLVLIVATMITIGFAFVWIMEHLG